MFDSAQVGLTLSECFCANLQTAASSNDVGPHERVFRLAPLIDWTGQMAGFWQSRFDHLEDLLKRMDQ